MRGRLPCRRAGKGIEFRGGRGALDTDGGAGQGSELLEPGEIIEDLQCDGLRIIARRDGFRYGTDSVLLANFAKAKRGDRVVELCSGTGAVSILMSAKTRAARIAGIEIQADAVAMANRSAALNNLSDKVSFMCGDIRGIRDLMRAGSAEVVVANPPYLSLGGGDLNRETGVAAARHEVFCEISDVLAAAKWLLNPGGRFFAVYGTARLVDLFYAMRLCGIEPKTLQFAVTAAHKPPAIALVAGVKGAAPGLRLTADAEIP